TPVGAPRLGALAVLQIAPPGHYQAETELPALIPPFCQLAFHVSPTDGSGSACLLTSYADLCLELGFFFLVSLVNFDRIIRSRRGSLNGNMFGPTLWRRGRRWFRKLVK